MRNRHIIKSDDVTNYSNWAIPSFGKKKRINESIEDIKKNLEIQNEKAKEMGYKNGYDEGFKSGEAAGLKNKEGELNTKMAILENIIKGFSNPISKFSQEIEQHLLKLLKLLFKNCIEREINLDDKIIVSLINNCLNEINLNKNEKYIYLNAQDKLILDSLLSTARPDLMNEFKNLKFEVSPDLDSGELFIKSEFSQLDATIDARIKNLLATDG